MRSVSSVIEEYDPTDETEEKKITLIQWFQKHPGRRFDRMEVHQELGAELEVGQARVGDYLKELEDENVLQSYGEQRISYRLADDIIIPIRYQIQAAFRHLYAIFHVNRWGAAGFIVFSTTLWALLTFPFLFFSAVLAVSPRDRIGTIHQSEIFILTIAMVIWLIILLIMSYSLYRIRYQWFLD